LAALAGLAPALAAWVLANPVAATNAGVVTADVAAQIASGAVTPGTVAESMAVKGGAVGANGGEAANAINGVKLNNQLTSQAVADGHAFGKHVNEFSDLGIKTEAQFQQHIETVINNATNNGPLNNGRSYFYDANSNTIVIKNPNAVDGGTVFRIDTTRYPNPLDYLKTLR
jgi:filamentous hemagglutinin